MQRWVVGVDLGGTQIRAVRTDLLGGIQARSQRWTNAQEGQPAVLARILEALEEVIAGVDPVSVRGVGIGVPGPIDAEGVMYDPPNLPGWKSIPLPAELGKALDLPVYAGNDANLAALAEHRFGAGRGVDDLVYVTVSTGVGGGIISGGRLLTGARGFAAEIGHQTLVPDGPLCGCGQPGHLEALASGPAIARQARSALEAGRSSSLAGALNSPEGLTARSVADAAAEGDALARELLEQAGFYLGLGLVNLIHILEPQRILLGGGVTRAGELLLRPVRTTVSERVMSPIYRTVEILPAQLGEDVGLMGAAALVLAQGN